MQASEIIDHIRILLGDENADYHTDAKMLIHLNRALKDICERSRSLRTAQYTALIKDQSAYGLVNTFLEMDIVGVIFNGEWCELDYDDLGGQLPHIFTNIHYGSYTPWKYTIWGQAHNEKVVTTVQEVVSHQTSYPGVGGGTFIAASEIPTVLKHDRLINITDNSEGVITDVDNPNGRITYQRLGGGADNEMAVDDQFRVVSPEAKQKNLIISPPPNKTDEKGVESMFTYFARSHQEITQARIDDRNDFLEIDPEFSSTLLHRIGYYASLDEKGLDHPATQSFDIKYETDYRTAIIPVRRRITQFISSWRKSLRGRKSIRGNEVINRRGNWDPKPY